MKISKRLLTAGIGIALVSGFFGAVSASPMASAAPVPSVSHILDNGKVLAATTWVARCQLVRYGGGGAGTVGYVTGYGSSRAAALSDADRQVPRGHYKRHCNTRISTGGRF